MKPLDSFRRTPLRRYDRAPQEETRVEHAGKFRRRHFDIPQLERSSHALPMLVCAWLLLYFVNGSAPLSEVPDVQTRFADWAKIHNEQTIKTLPGATPEPGSELAQALAFDQQAVLEQVQVQAAATPTPEPVKKDEEGFKIYQPGELSYQTDKLSVSIEQKKKDGITYFVCDVQATDVSQFRTAFAGDDFKSGIYEAVSDIASRHSPVIAINADFCRYHREGVIIRNGEVLRRQNIKKHHLLVVDENGNLSAQTDRSGKQGLVANKLEQQNTWQTFEFGPVLIKDGEAVSLPKSFYVNCGPGYYEPRTAIGQKGPLHYVLIVVDGRRDGYSTGCDIPKLQELFLEEDVEFAFNLDGGGSTTLYFLGEVINMPSGGKQRSVSDVIMFMPNPV